MYGDLFRKTNSCQRLEISIGSSRRSTEPSRPCGRNGSAVIESSSDITSANLGTNPCTRACIHRKLDSTNWLFSQRLTFQLWIWSRDWSCKVRPFSCVKEYRFDNSPLPIDNFL